MSNENWQILYVFEGKDFFFFFCPVEMLFELLPLISFYISKQHSFLSRQLEPREETALNKSLKMFLTGFKLCCTFSFKYFHVKSDVNSLSEPMCRLFIHQINGCGATGNWTHFHSHKVFMTFQKTSHYCNYFSVKYVASSEEENKLQQGLMANYSKCIDTSRNLFL